MLTRQRRQYNAPMDVNLKPPYSELTPDRVLDALSSVGLCGDGRLLSLNSYENPVYQVWLVYHAPQVGLLVLASTAVANFCWPLRTGATSMPQRPGFCSDL